MRKVILVRMMGVEAKVVKGLILAETTPVWNAVEIILVANGLPVVTTARTAVKLPDTLTVRWVPHTNIAHTFVMTVPRNGKAGTARSLILGVSVKVIALKTTEVGVESIAMLVVPEVVGMSVVVPGDVDSVAGVMSGVILPVLKSSSPVRRVQVLGGIGR